MACVASRNGEESLSASPNITWEGDAAHLGGAGRYACCPRIGTVVGAAPTARDLTVSHDGATANASRLARRSTAPTRCSPR